MQIKDLKQDRRNYRKHNQRNLDLIKKSVDEVGLGRSVVIDNQNEIICGNGLVSTLDKNTPIKVIETDGSELVVVKRTDLATDDAKRKQLAVMDNSTSDSSDFDVELLQEDFNAEVLGEWGIDLIPDMDIELEEKEDIKKDLNDLRGLIYEKQGKKPTLQDCFIENPNISIIKEQINNSNISNEEKQFLLKALTRFYKFNFKNIAEYYCHSSEELKRLFEELLLVIPDGKKLLRNKLLALDDIISEELIDE